MKNILYNICLLGLLLINIDANALTRDQVLNNGLPYHQILWQCDSVNAYSSALGCSSAFDVGQWSMGEAYCWSRWDKPLDEFMSKLSAGELAGCIYSDFSYDEINGNATGIDCSGFVSRCLNLYTQYSTKPGTKYVLQEITMEIDNDQMQPGDILIIPNVHTMLFIGGKYENAKIIESVIRTSLNVYQVWCRENVDCGSQSEGAYLPYTIFPQFSDITPTPNDTEEIINKPFTIQLKAEGSVSIETVKMWLDGDSVIPAVHGEKTSKTIKYKPENIAPGKHYVKVQCSNVVNGIAYEDTVSWYFRYGKPGWYECSDNIYGKDAYWLVMDNSSMYELYRDAMPVSWNWAATLKGVDTLTDLHLMGIYDMPRWATTSNDTLGYTDNQPLIAPISNGGYNITVNGTVISSMDGVHEYMPNTYGNYWNRVLCPPTDLHNLKIANPSNVTISYLPPVWPSMFDTTLVYLNSEGVIIGSPQLNAFAAGSLRILWGEDVKPLPSVAYDEGYNSTYENLSNKMSREDFLKQNNPNPFIQSTNFQYSLKTESDVSLKIYNLQGQLVKTLVKSSKTAGVHNIIWDCKNDKGAKVCQGVYLYRITAGTYSATKKLLLLK